MKYEVVLSAIPPAPWFGAILEGDVAMLIIEADSMDVDRTGGLVFYKWTDPNRLIGKSYDQSQSVTMLIAAGEWVAARPVG